MTQQIDQIKEDIKKKAHEIGVLLTSMAIGYHGKVEIVVKDGVVVNVMQTESLDMR